MEELFWKVVESSGSPISCDPEEQCKNITIALQNFSEENLISFSNIHRDLMRQLYTWDLLKAAYVIIGYVSDDVFQDFRNWVIIHGK